MYIYGLDWSAVSAVSDLCDWSVPLPLSLSAYASHIN